MSERALNKSEVMKVRSLILAWSGKKLTWAALLQAIKNDLGIKVSKPTVINTYPAIYSDYLLKKNQLRGVVSIDDSPITAKDIRELKISREKLEKCRAERDMYKKDYELAQAMIERVITNANLIPNINVLSLFEDID
jgi:intein-encoded DNA endonuclease-like protein